jgi:transmembrane 9 superfamily protein 2/4
MTAVLFLFAIMGVAAGYFAARLYQFFKLKEWKVVTAYTAFAFPGFVFFVFFVLNLFVWGTGSSGAVPFGTLFALMCLWFFVSIPLVCAGAYLGFAQHPLESPVRVNQIPKVIPPQPWYMTTIPTLFLGSLLPFGAIFIELYLILSSIWLHQFYYVFGFLLLVLLLLVITCAEISILLTYFQLCAEDYHWWWRSFLAPGTMAVHVFVLSIYYFFTSLQITGFVSSLLYFGYSFLISVLVFLLAGSVGFIATFIFNMHIYGSIKLS